MVLAVYRKLWDVIIDGCVSFYMEGYLYIVFTEFFIYADMQCMYC